MLASDLPETASLLDLIGARHPASVTIVAPSSPIPADRRHAQLQLREGIDEAARQLAEAEVDDTDRDAVLASLRALLDDEEFWQSQSRSTVVLASPGRVEAFRLPSRLEARASVGDRFDAGQLLRAVSFPRRAFVVQVSREGGRLSELGPDLGLTERRLELPDDLWAALEHTTTDGQRDMPRPQGTTGDRIEREKFSRIIQDAVVRVVPADVPLILAASQDLEPAYRAVNTHRLLLERGIDAHPDSLSRADLEQAARDILDAHEQDELAQWRERFGSLRAQGLATSSVREAAVAASTAAVDELLFDLAFEQEGVIDEAGHITRAPDAGPSTYAILDEIAARVLGSGGRVRAVRSTDLPDGAPVAAVLRFPLPADLA
jgi:hypothetical protein